jgi:hypothetical protein
LVGDIDEDEEEELDKKPPASKSPPVMKAIVAKVVEVLKKPLSRSSAVAMACAQQKGFDDDIILMLSDKDKVEKLTCNNNTGLGMVLTMLQEEETVFNLPWKDYIRFDFVCVTCFVNCF